MDTNDKTGFWRTTGQALGLINPREIAVPEVRVAGAGVIPPARSDISSITPELALSIGAVHRSISILTASVSQMELGVYREGIEIKSPSIINQPNINDSVTGFIEETVYSLAAYGNAYWRLYGDSPVQSIEVLDPNSVTVTTHETTGNKVYFIGDKQVPSKNIKHLRLMRKPGHLKGYGPIQHGQSELIGAMRLRNFADNWFNISGVPQGLLTTDMVLGPEEAASFATAWNAFIKNHGTAVLSQGMRYETIHLKPADAQFLEIQAASVVAVARLFGIPAMHLLAETHGTSNTYLNLEQANIVFLQTTLSRYMTEIEEALSSLLPRGQRVQFKEDTLLRMDSVTKWGVIKTQTEIGYTSGSELRKEEGKSPLPTPKPIAPVQDKTNKDNEGETE